MLSKIKPFSDCRVLIVDDEITSRILFESILESFVTCQTASSGREAIQQCRQEVPDLVLLDMNMPDKNGLEVCQALRVFPETASIPIIFVTATMDVQVENACWEVGASDFVMKPVNASTLTHRIKTHLENKTRTEFLESMIYHDQLTGLYNRSYLAKEIPKTVKQVARDKGSVGAILIDIDRFKLFNDNYGHLEGDMCLQQVASIVENTVKRPKDAVIRFGGEEFLVLLPYVDENGARIVAEQIVSAVNNANIIHEYGIDGIVTISAGYATKPARDLIDSGVNPLIKNADVALFTAKEKGKNQAIGFFA
ncbi:GGDEF domain-containing response regulator [Alteromonas sp. BMJM2]|uniref:GGDEF domain-containing response regulator n=1 Tax=Alteromonas sp. BMJM2 TaxID=2954241 RepID=UPI0022B2B336|nr:diguanylate cyclase [Alteromonas sp. BMJM2]